MSETFTFTNREEGWMRVCGAKTLGYVSTRYGDVVLVRWANGDISILREADSGAPSCMTVSKECIDKMDELRGTLPPDEASLAGSETTTYGHPDGGIITTKSTWKDMPAPSKRRAKKR
jgi:hypothetical protein